ncbi:tungsten formylmethanofuran dehydrogenase [bacterium]|nr:tungsten formylmethanofuran dehydrogenase [bacterium]
MKHAETLDATLLRKAYSLMCTSAAMAALYEANKEVTAKYVHASSRGHEAVQLALSLQLRPQDWVSPYYRDDSILLGIGMSPYELMLQLLAKKDDPFSGGRTYYSHPSLNREGTPRIIHQSSATGMQAIPTAGLAMGVQYRIDQGLDLWEPGSAPVVVCSIGDAAMTEGEVSEALQMAVLRKLPLLFLVQDNGWDISANAAETRAQNAAEFASGFKGLGVLELDGSDFEACYSGLSGVLEAIRAGSGPVLVRADVPLLGHHTSGVRKEWYRDDLDEHAQRDPLPRLRQTLVERGVAVEDLDAIAIEAEHTVQGDYQQALAAEDPSPESISDHVWAPTPITEEQGEREPQGRERTVMVDSALFAIRELLEAHPEALLYGQDVGRRLGGVFREAATLAEQFGDGRVFNTPIQEAFIIGSTVGMSAAGLKPIVEVQFADYLWPGLNQLFTELSRSLYLSNGKWPVSAVIRVPIGAYGSGGPYHSSSIETVVCNIKGIKVVYPSTGADLKGLLKAAFYDPNPVVVLEHKGLYWSKIKGTEAARTLEPSSDYVVPIGKARTVLSAEPSVNQSTAVVVAYGMGIYWALEAAKTFEGRIEILDLRSLSPIDERAIEEVVRKHGRVLVVTEEPVLNSFGRNVAGWIQETCFRALDAPVLVLGSENVPAIPLNSTLEAAVLPNPDKLRSKLEQLLNY